MYTKSAEILALRFSKGTKDFKVMVLLRKLFIVLFSNNLIEMDIDFTIIDQLWFQT